MGILSSLSRRRNADPPPPDDTVAVYPGPQDGLLTIDVPAGELLVTNDQALDVAAGILVALLDQRTGPVGAVMGELLGDLAERMAQLSDGDE